MLVWKWNEGLALPANPPKLSVVRLREPVAPRFIEKVIYST
jgi:hypothetical protein